MRPGHGTRGTVRWLLRSRPSATRLSISSFSLPSTTWRWLGQPLYVQFLRRLASFARVVIVERRGTGLSDRYSADDLPTRGTRRRPHGRSRRAGQSGGLFGSSDAGALADVPQRVRSVYRPDLYATAARGTQAPDYPWQWVETRVQDYLAAGCWMGTPAYAERRSPCSILRLPDELLAWWGVAAISASPARCMPKSSPGDDIRRLLTAIGVPTLVLHRRDDQIEPVGAGRYISEVVSGARYVELEGADHFPWAGDQEALCAEVQRFLTELRDEDEASLNRILATVLFTDIVSSTAQSATMGDRGWRDVREQHDRQARGQLARFRGREVKTMGDGFLAVFDGPARAVRCASELSNSVTRLGIEVRCGLHAGEIELDGQDVAGIAVAIGARIGAWPSRERCLSHPP